MAANIFILIISLFLVIKGATLSTKYASRLAESYRLSPYTVGFIIVAIISILPETFISINAALEGVPAFGLGVLFGSNIADLTLIFTIIILFAGRDLKIESKVLKSHAVYPTLLFLPLILGLDGSYSRFEGGAMVLIGTVFYFIAFKNGHSNTLTFKNGHGRYESMVLLIFSMALLLVGSHFTVTSATALAYQIGITPILIGMLIVGLGTTIPELFFSIKSVEKKNDSLAVGDILGTVLADATIVVGILALISPFSFPQKIIYITGIFMVAASFMLFHYMHSGRTLTRKEAYALLAFWIAFVIVEFLANM